MNVRSMCLAILFCGDTTGYDIRKASTEGNFSFFVEASFGSIYPALSRLEADGLVTCRHEAQDGKPARKIYSITQAGKRSFIEELMQSHRPDIFRSEFLLIALYAQLIGPDAMRRAIDLQIHYLEQEWALIDGCSNEEECGDAAKHHEQEKMIDPAVARWTQNYGLYCVQASIDYLKENGDALVALAANTSQARQDSDDEAVAARPIVTGR